MIFSFCASNSQLDPNGMGRGEQVSSSVVLNPCGRTKLRSTIPKPLGLFIFISFVIDKKPT